MSIIIIILIYIYAGYRSGPVLTIKAFFIYTILVGIISSEIAKFLSRISTQNEIISISILWAFVVISEDTLRTWFVNNNVIREISVKRVSVSFAIAASLMELIVQLYDLLAYAFGNYSVAEGEYEGYYIWFFSSDIAMISTIIIYAIRPFIHYFLCILLFNLFQWNNKYLYSLVIILHIVVDIIIAILVISDPVYLEFLVLVTSFAFLVALTLFNIFLVGNKQGLR